MSWEATSWALDQSAGGVSAKCVLLVLAEAADNLGCTWVGHDTIAVRAELTRRSVIDQMKALETRGLIRREHRHNPQNGHRTSDRVFLAMPGLSATASPRVAAQGEAFALGDEKPNDPHVQTVQALSENDDAPKCKVFTGTYLEPIREPPGDISLPLPIEPSTALVVVDVTPANDFEAWWTLFPKRVGKAAAAKVFAQVLKSGRATAAQLMDGALAYASATAGKDPNFTKHPAGWLRDGRWADEPEIEGAERPHPSNTRAADRAVWADVFAAEQAGWPDLPGYSAPHQSNTRAEKRSVWAQGFAKVAAERAGEDCE